MRVLIFLPGQLVHQAAVCLIQSSIQGQIGTVLLIAVWIGLDNALQAYLFPEMMEIPEIAHGQSSHQASP